MSKGFSMFTGLFEENGSVPWHDRGNPQFSACRPLLGQEIATVHDAVEADPVGVYCLLLPELWKRKINIEASFSCVTNSDDSKTGHSFINNHGRVPRVIREKNLISEEHSLMRSIGSLTKWLPALRIKLSALGCRHYRTRG